MWCILPRVVSHAGQRMSKDYRIRDLCLNRAQWLNAIGQLQLLEGGLQVVHDNAMADVKLAAICLAVNPLCRSTSVSRSVRAWPVLRMPLRNTATPQHHLRTG